ncbi:MAG: tail fiber domain-containing protein [Bacteroidales bacterium]
MKKLLLIALTIIPMSMLNAQIQMNSSGNVGIGTSPISNFKLVIDGGYSPVRFQNLYGYHAAIDASWEETTFYPTVCNTGYLGKYDKYWYAIYSNHYYYKIAPSSFSDKRFKEDISSITDTDVDKLLKVKGVTFKFKEEVFNYKELDSLSNGAKNSQKKKKDLEIQYGFLAQDIYELYPNIGNYDSIEDVYTLQPTAFIPILIEGHKKQQELIEEMQNEIEMLKGQIKNIDNSKLKSTSGFLGGFHEFG